MPPAEGFWSKQRGRTLVRDCETAQTIQNLIDALPAQIAIVDRGYTIAFVNEAWCDYCDRLNFDFPAYGIGGDYFEVGLKYGAIDSIKAIDIAEAIDAVRRGEQRRVVRTYQTSFADGDRHNMLTISPFLNDKSTLILMSHLDVTEAVNVAQARERLAISLSHAQAYERQRIARELHDTTVQTVAAIGIELAILKAEEGAEARAAIMSGLDTLVATASRQVRLFSYALHSPELHKLGLQAALQEYIDGLSHRTGLKISLDWQVRDRTRIARYKLAMFRIVQEGLWNVHQHSGAANAFVAIVETDDAVCLTISDTGKGIDSAEGHAGLGLESMRERAEEQGGTLTIDGTDDGTRITVRFPIAGYPGLDGLADLCTDPSRQSIQLSDKIKRGRPRKLSEKQFVAARDRLAETHDHTQRLLSLLRRPR